MSAIFSIKTLRCYIVAIGLAAGTSPARAQFTMDASGSATAATDAERRNTERGEDTDFNAGGLLGYARLDNLSYIAPTLTADIRLSLLQSALRIPLRFRQDNGEVRRADWDETGDYLRVAQCARIDWSANDRFEQEEGFCLPWRVERDDYYFTARLGPVHDFTLGHGTILRSYSNDVDPDHFHGGVIAGMQFHQFVVGEYVLDDVIRPSMMAGRFAFRPFAYETEGTAQLYEQQHQFQLEVTGATDLRAPQRIRTAFGQALTDSHANLLYSEAPVGVIGADFQYRYVFGTQVEFEARADFNMITGYGKGGHGQLWWIYNHPDGDYTVRGIGEFRYIEPNYIPNYFDSYYLIQRQQFALGAEQQESAADPFITKQEFLEGLSTGTWEMGYLAGLHFEAYRGTGDDRQPWFIGRASIADNLEREHDGQFLVTAQLPRFGNKIDLFGLYSRQDFNTPRDILKLDNTLVKVIVRWDLNDEFYLLMNYGRIWQIDVTATGTTNAGFNSINEFNFSLGFAEGLTS